MAVAAQLAIVSTAQAERGTATLTGFVRDATTGEPIEGALVVVQSTALQGEESFTTDARGTYRLPNLPAGTYTLQVFAQNYESNLRKGLELRADSRIRIDAKLRTADDAEAVREVVVPAPIIDIGSTSIGQSVDSEFARRVPIAQPTGKGAANRSFESMAEATPGAAGDQYGVSIAGSTSPENNYTVDGLNVGGTGFGLNGTPLSVEFLKEVTIDSGGYMPEYGRSTGGVLNAVTKSGSNEFHGSIWAYYTPGQLEGQRKQIRRDGSTVVPDSSLSWIGDAGFEIGGPIIKDRLWFYTGFSVARTVYNIDRDFARLVIDPDTGETQVDASGEDLREIIPGTREHRLAESTQLQALAKFDWRANDQHRISLTGIVAPTLTGGDGNYSIDPQTGLSEIFNNQNGTYGALATIKDSLGGDVIFNWNATTKNKAWNFETVVGYHHQQNENSASDGTTVGSPNGLAGLSQVSWRRSDPLHNIIEFENVSPEAREACLNIEYLDNGDPATAVPCPLTTYLTGGPGLLQTTTGHRLRLKHLVTFFGEGAGHHEVKFGVDGEYLAYNSERGFSGSRTFREYRSGAAFYDFRGYGVVTGPDELQRLSSLKYFNQSYVLGFFAQDSWAIMDKVTLNVGLRYDAQMMFAGDGKLSLALPNQVSPRVGIIWDPTQSGRSKIFGSYGRFFQTVPLNLADRAGSGEPGAYGDYVASGCDPRTGDGQRSDGCSIPNYINVGDPRLPDTVVTGGGGPTPVDPKLKPQAQDELVFGGEYEIFPDARLGLTYQRRWLVRLVEDMSRDDGVTYFIGNPGEGLAADFPKGKRIYDAITLRLKKRFSEHWLLDASYTASWLRGNVDGLFRPSTGQLDPFINSDFDLVSLLDNRDGPLSADTRHRIQIYSAGEFNLGEAHAVSLGGGFRANSGGPTNYLGGHEYYGTGEAYILPRGSGDRLPWIFTLDTNIGYRYQISPKLGVGVTVDIFNLLNLQSEVRRDENYTFDPVYPIVDGSEEDLAELRSLLDRDEDGMPDEVIVNPNFGNATSYQPPRQFRFGVRFTF